MEGGGRKGNPPTLMVGMSVGLDTATMENNTEVPQKTKNRMTLRSSKPIPGHMPRKN